MFGISPLKWKWIVGILVVANIVNYLYSGLGLVTVKVRDVPLSKVIHSIEWQGWVKIYTNLPLDTKVTMYVDRVPLAEAMETLAANVDPPAPPPGEDDGTPPRRDRPGNPPGGFPTGGRPAGAPGGLGAGGPPGGRGGFGRRVEWNLAFFVAPTAAQVRQEIAEFQTSDPDTNAKVYSYGTQIQLFSTDTVTTAPDPHQQAWPGVKPPAPAPADTQTNSTVATTAPANDSQADPPDDGPPTVQTYLQDFAQAANIWIMADSSWAPPVAKPPPPSSSIIRAVENLIGSAHGVVTQALVLRVGRGGPRGGTPDVAGGDAWADRMRNAINGLPPDQRPDALEQLNKEVQFRKDIQSLPPEQRRKKFMEHAAERMLYGERLSRLSPEKRAQVYQRMLALRAAAKAQK